MRVKCFTQEYNTISPARAQNPDHSIPNQTHKPYLNGSINDKPEGRGGGAYVGHLTSQKNVWSKSPLWGPKIWSNQIKYSPPFIALFSDGKRVHIINYPDNPHKGVLSVYIEMK